MPDTRSTRLVFRVEFVSAASIDGTDDMLVTLRTCAPAPLELRMTRPEAADLVGLIAAERLRGVLGSAEPTQSPGSIARCGGAG